MCMAMLCTVPEAVVQMQLARLEAIHAPQKSLGCPVPFTYLSVCMDCLPDPLITSQRSYC
jgi:hypothetical protein